MANDRPPTMFEWMFQPNTILDRILHLGFAGFIVAILVKNIISQITPAAGTTTFLCFAFSLLLAFPAIIGMPPRDLALRWPTLSLAVAYAWMSLLYFFSWTHLVTLSAGYDAITDLVGTLFFLVAWFLFSGNETEKEGQVAERVALAILCLVALMAG